MDTTRGGRGPTNTETPYPRSLKSYLLEAAGTRPRCRRTADQLDEVAYFVVLPIRSRAVVRHGLLNPNQAFSNLALALTRSVVSKPSLKDP